MKWRGQRQSSNIEDRRTSGAVGKGLKLGGGGLVLMVVIGLISGKSPMQILGMVGSNLLGGGGGGQQLRIGGSGDGEQRELTAEEKEVGKFVSAVLANTEDVWNKVLPEQAGQDYPEPTLVLFSQQVSSACGMQSAAVGPFYCPGDSKVYLDTSFFAQLKRRFDAPGDFAQAYVVAHEVGHHLQNVLGTSTRVHRAQQRASKVEANELSVRLELQADCYSGVWAHYAKQKYDMLESGDIKEGLTAANAIGDDNIQKQARGRVVPDSFTHGTGEQRVRWFTRGFKSGDMSQCDTFNASSL